MPPSDPQPAHVARGFVGRAEELVMLEDLFGAEPVAPVVFVHGPGGIGKSALLREVARRAAMRGLTVLGIDGREREAAQEHAPQVLAGVGETERSLVVLDGYEHVAALGALLRSELGPHLGARARLLIAGRQPPESAWSRGGWEAVVRVLRLRSLAPGDARVLLERRGVRDPAAVEGIAGWAAGSPLALVVAADALLAGQVLDLARLDADGALAQALMGRLAGDELNGADREVLAVAAIARAVDARLLAAVLPGIDADHAEQWLRSRSFAEPFGVRVTLHERVRRAARGALLASDPEYDRELRRRLADYLFGRAVLGELSLLPDLTELIDDPVVRSGISPSQHAATHRAGPPEPGDAQAIAARLDAHGAEWWNGVLRWFEQAPEHVLVVRDAAGAIASLRIAVTPASAPDWASEDRILGPWLADARSRYSDGDVLLFREAIDLTQPQGDGAQAPSPAIAVGNVASVLRSGLPTLRAVYAGIFQDNTAQLEFVRTLDYEVPPELEIVDAERTVRCYINDFGPGGAIGFTRKLVYRDLGLQPPPERPPAATGADTVRDTLRAFHDPHALAASPLARGVRADQRAASVRRLLREAVAAAFGDTEEERLLRATVERGYLDPEGGHVRAQSALHLSRASYFRHLRAAVARVCTQVLDARA